MQFVSALAVFPILLLRLSCCIRLGMILALSALILLILWVTSFPLALLFLWAIPLLLSGWLFRWQGGLLFLAGVILLVAVVYSVTYGITFWASIWGAFLLTRIIAGVLVTLVIAGLRQMTDTLLETRQAYQQAHLLNAAKDQILYSLNHELRTPLTQIQGYLELLSDYYDQLDSATRTQYLARAQGGCDELLGLISTALDTVPGTRKRRPLQLQTFSLSYEVQMVMMHFTPAMLQEHPLLLEIDDTFYAQGEPRFVRQIIRNLLTNACRYTPAQTAIRLRAEYLHEQGETESICVQVIDSGPGIPPEQQGLLFQQFVRLPNAYLTNIPGSGLGLAICRQLVEAMGGRIWVESSGQKGEGCCFSFTLAVGEKPASPIAPSPVNQFASDRQR